MIRKHEAIRVYLNDVCSRVRSLEAHREIRQELENHLEELVLEREEEGMERDEAVLWAISQMGSPTEVGDGLHSVHRPRMHWGLLVGVLMFVIFGILAMYAVEEEITTGNSVMYAQYVNYKILSVGIGLFLMVFFYFFNYRKIRSYSYGLYTVIIAGMLLTGLTGVSVNGTSHYLRLPFFTLDWFGISPYLLMVAAPGMIMNWKNHKRFWLLTTTAFLIVPMLLFLQFTTLGNLMLYIAGYLLLLLYMTRSWWTIGIHAIAMGLFMLLGMIQRNFSMERITTFLNPDKDPDGSGYIYRVTGESIRSAGWWGQGIKGELTKVVPNIPNENIVVFLIYSFGWVIGIVLLISVVYFVGRLLQANRAVRDPYGRALGTGVVGMLSFQMVFSLFMTLGLVPFVGIPFPFLSYGGSHLMIELATMGLVLGIYRRKDLVGSSGELQTQSP
ncbi:FtsW/RodA/SpoVE family cell cycle protein [Paenibacillus antarcticus]|uniref:Cell division protein FtsW n=1 Tax=Paenibacillus antarcticus TaxID=253703 RepID=A0A168MP50_9BACL|nr:FtsW/RodA/SpoVE family cell cycle protein [Paenibacillus antarcticus]OAB44899.1 hypothetical protein PBAT_15070 [Paenibacillus antarcticus]